MNIRFALRRTAVLTSLFALLTTAAVAFAGEPSASTEKPTSEKPAREQAVTARQEVARLLLGDQREKVVTRDDLRPARAHGKLPPRPSVSPQVPAEKPVAPAERLWTKEDLFEDPDEIKRLWRFEQEAPSERKLKNYRAFAELPREADVGTKVLQSEWTPIGNGIHGGTTGHHRAGRIRAVQYVYDQELGYTTVYVASSGGGLFRLVNVLFFAIWEPITDNLPAEAMVGAFKVDETDSDRILVATGDWSRRWGTGVYRSLDGGDSWHRTPLDPFPLNSFRIAQDSLDPDIVLLAGLQSYADDGQAHGLWRSEDFGGSWTQIYDGAVTDVVQDPAFPQYWMAGAPGVGVLESSDGGRTFHAIGGNGGSGLGGAGTGRIDYAVSESRPNYHYLLAGTPSGNMHGIWRSTNYGYSWTRIDQGDTISWGLASSTGAIAVDPDDHGRLFVGMGGGQWTDNADATPANICWHLNAGSSGSCGANFDGGHADFHSFTFVPEAVDAGNTRVIVSNDGGVYIFDWSTNAIDASANLMGLNVGQHWPNYYATLASSKTDPDVALAGTFDNGVVKIDVGAAQKIRGVTGGDGGKVNISPDDAEHFFVGYGLGWRRAMSLDGGVSWPTVDCSLMLPTFGPPALQADSTPGFGNTIYTYEDRFVYTKAANTTCDWSRVNGAGDPVGPPGFAIKQLEQAVTPYDYIFYVTGRGSEKLYVLQGGPLGSVVPEDRTPPVGSMTSRDAAVFADRSGLNAERIYYTSGTGRPIQAWLSTTAGDTWVDVRGNLGTLLPDAHLREMVGHPGNPNLLFLATDAGVLRSDDRGATWYRYMNGLPEVIDAMSIELVYDNADEPTLTIGSFGRGWWKRVIDDAPAEAPGS